MDPVLIAVNQEVDNALQHLQKELSSIRAGRANPSLIEELAVMAYGTRMKLMEVGTIGAPQPALLTIQVWDASLIKDVEKAILESNIGLTPAVDGTMIRLNLPPLTEERREEFIKLVYQKGEACKVKVRQVRQDNRSKWDSEKKSGVISEDELFRREKLLQDLIDKSISTIDEYVKAKEEDLKQI